MRGQLLINLAIDRCCSSEAELSYEKLNTLLIKNESARQDNTWVQIRDDNCSLHSKKFSEYL